MLLLHPFMAYHIYDYHYHCHTSTTFTLDWLVRSKHLPAHSRSHAPLTSHTNATFQISNKCDKVLVVLDILMFGLSGPFKEIGCLHSQNISVAFWLSVQQIAQGWASPLSGFVTLQTTILGYGPAQVCGHTLDCCFLFVCVVREANIIAFDHQLLHFAAPMGQRNPHAALKTWSSSITLLHANVAEIVLGIITTANCMPQSIMWR